MAIDGTRYSLKTSVFFASRVLKYSGSHMGKYRPAVLTRDSIAHLWQLLMAGQLPVLADFIINWLPRSPKETLCVLGLQAGAVLAATVPSIFLDLQEQLSVRVVAQLLNP